MIRRIVSVIATVLGLVVIALAVCSATVWRPSATVQATLAQTPDQHYVLTEPGVLGLVDSSVSITATAEGRPVFLAVAYTVDAKAWLADDPYLSVTGLTDWNTLSAVPVTERCETADPATADPAQTASPGAEATAGTQAPADGATADSTGSGGSCTTLADSNADPSQADLWLKTASGQGTATLDNVVEPDTVLLAATDGSGPAPRITLSWPRAVSTPWLVPGIILGGLLLLAGVFGLLIDIQMRRADSQRRERAAERAARRATADSVSTAGLPRVEDPDRPLTRREVREKERAEAAGEEWMDPRTGVVYIGGVEAPGVPLASESAPGYDSAPGTGYDSAPSYGPAPGSDPVPGPGYGPDFGYDSAADSGYGPAPDSAPEADYGAQPGSEADGYGAQSASEAGYGSQSGSDYGSQSVPEAGYGAQSEAGYGAAPWDQPPSGPAAGFDGGAAPGSDFGAQLQPGYGAQPDLGYDAQPDGYGSQSAPEAGYGTQSEAGYGAAPWDQPPSGPAAGFDGGAAPGSGDSGYGGQQPDYGAAPGSDFATQFQADYGAQPDSGYDAQPAPEASGYDAQPDGYGSQSAPEAGYGAQSEAGYGAAPWDRPASGPAAGFDGGAAPGSGDSGYGGRQPDYGAQPGSGYGAQPAPGYGATPGYGAAPWDQPGQPPSDRLPDSGAARGGAVVPGLDEQATTAYRASRGLDDTNPLGLVPGTDGAGDDDEENTR